jgi:hypothetical protein
MVAESAENLQNLHDAYEFRAPRQLLVLANPFQARRIGPEPFLSYSGILLASASSFDGISGRNEMSGRDQR